MSRAGISGTCGSTTSSSGRSLGMLARMAVCMPVGSPTNSARWAAMPRAVLSVGRRPAGALEMQHLVAERVQRPRHPGAHPPRPEHPAVMRGSRSHRRPGRARPLRGECAVEEPGQVGDVDLLSVGRQPVQRGLDAEPDDPDLAGLVDQYVLRGEPPVGDARVVRAGDRVGHLGHQPGRSPRAERPGAGHQDVEGDARAPLVDDVADPVADLRVEHPEDPSVEDGGRTPRRLQQTRRAIVLRVDHVQRDVTFEHPVVGAPEPTPLALGEQVDQSITTGEDLTGPDRVRHLFLSVVSRSPVRPPHRSGVDARAIRCCVTA